MMQSGRGDGQEVHVTRSTGSNEMLSLKGAALAAGALIAVILGIALRNYQALVLSIFIFVFLAFSHRHLPGNLYLKRSLPSTRTMEGDEIAMRLSLSVEEEDRRETKGRTKGERKKKGKEKRRPAAGLRGRGRRGPASLGQLSGCIVEMMDELPSRMAVARESNHKLLYLPSGMVRGLHYSVFCPVRGHYTIGPMHVRIADPFGIVSRELPPESDISFPVHIKYHTLKSFDLAASAFDWNMGQNLLNIQGLSNEFYSLRDYTKQDSYRDINWKATARKRRIMVNTYERETLADCCIFVDARGVCGLGRVNDNFLEYAVRLAYGLARTIVDDNNRLALVTYGKSIRIVPPGLGRNHTAYLEALLLEVMAEGQVPLKTALVHSRPYLRPGSTVVIFSPMDYDWSFHNALGILQSMDVRIVVATSRVVNFEGRAVGEININIKNRLDRERFETKKAELKRYGVRLVEWDPEDSAEMVLRNIHMATVFHGYDI